MKGVQMGKKEADAAFSRPEPFLVYEARIVKRDVICSTERKDLGETMSANACGEQVRLQEGLYFDYGKGDQSLQCFADLADSEECEEGFQDNPGFDFYALDQFKVFPNLVKIRKNCNSKGKIVGKYGTIQDCAKAVQEIGGRFFTFGTHLPFAGACTIKYTKNRFCPEGFKGALADFYAMRFMKVNTADEIKESKSTLVQGNKACNSEDEYLGWFATQGKCADATREAGGKFFIWGKKFTRWLCYVERTESAECPEGFHKDTYDFYQILDDG